MSATAPPIEVDYPDSDGEPMADNTLQYEWIATVMWNLDAQFRDRPDVFVASDHLIYAVEGDPTARQAPDAYVAFGRPKGHRGSYKVWEEDGLFPQVVFEVWSPGNRADKMAEKRAFYERHGAEEYYILYPEFPAHVEVWVRAGGRLTAVRDFAGWESPRLGVTFRVAAGELSVFGPDGRAFVTPTVMIAERDNATAERDAATAERDAAERRVKAAAEARDAAAARAEALAAKLRELGVDPDSL